jgi:hypothetical protein
MSGSLKPLAQFGGEPHGDAIVFHLSDTLSGLPDTKEPITGGLCASWLF